MTGPTALDDSHSPVLREVQEAGRHPTDGSLALLVGYANHPDPIVRAEVVESLGRLDTAEAHQWIVALAATETDDSVRHSICRAARYWTLKPLASLIEAWVRKPDSNENLRLEGISALVEMQAKERLRRLSAETSAGFDPALGAKVQGVLASATVNRGSRDILARETATPLWSWRLWHEDGTKTVLLDDGSVLGPEYRGYDPWMGGWWPAHVRREGRLNLRRDILALTNGDPSAVRKVLEAGLQTPAAASILHTAIPWIDDPDDILVPQLDHPDPLLRASAWGAVAAFGTVELRTRSVDHLKSETVPSVRHMALSALRGDDSETAARLLCDSMAADDHVERAVACSVASFAAGLELVPSLRRVAMADPSAVCRDTAARAIAKVEGQAK